MALSMHAKGQLVDNQTCLLQLREIDVQLSRVLCHALQSLISAWVLCDFMTTLIGT